MLSYYIMELPKNPRKKPQKKKVEYYCKKCDFRCSNKKNFKRHKMTAKHLGGFHGNRKHYSVEYYCDTCGKSYKHRSGLSRHKKKCFIMGNESVDFGEKMVTDVTMLPKKNIYKEEDFCDMDMLTVEEKHQIEILEKDAEINALKIQMLEKELKHKDQIIVEFMALNFHFNNCDDKIKYFSS